MLLLEAPVDILLELGFDCGYSTKVPNNFIVVITPAQYALIVLKYEECAFMRTGSDNNSGLCLALQFRGKQISNNHCVTAWFYFTDSYYKTVVSKIANNSIQMKDLCTC